jgi:hypothetical protein
MTWMYVNMKIQFRYCEKHQKFCTKFDHTNGLIISVIVSSGVDDEFNPWSCQTHDHQIGICCFSTKQEA